MKDDPIPVYDASTFYETISVFGASFSADETRILFTSDASGVYNVYSQLVAGGKPLQLTQSKDDAYIGISFFPADDRILFTADQGGNELTQEELVDSLNKLGMSTETTPRLDPNARPASRRWAPRPDRREASRRLRRSRTR